MLTKVSPGRRLLPGVLALVLSFSPSSAASSPEIEALEKAADRLVQTLAMGGERWVVAVVGFEIPGAGPVMLSRLLGGMVEQKLIGSRKFVVVVRDELGRVLAEGQQAINDLFEKKSKMKLGELKVASALVMGEIIRLADGVHLRARLVTVQEAVLLNSANAWVTRTPGIAELLKPVGQKQAPPVPPMGNFTVWGPFATLEQTSQSLRVELWADKDKEGNIYRAGRDTIRFFFRTNRECYLTLVDFGTSGNVTVLFPNAFERDNRIRPGEVYVIPDRYGKFKFPVLPPVGVEMVKAICTLRPVDLSALGLPRQGFGSLRRERTRDIEVAQSFAQSLSRMERAEASVMIHVR